MTASARETQKQHQQLLENLKLLQKIHGADTLSEVLGVHRNTWTNRMKEPWKLFCIDDLRLISKYCRVDFAQLIDGSLKLR